MNERQSAREALTKVPAVTLGFWIIKVLATTLGETGGDTVTMSWLGETTDHPVPNGYLIGTAHLWHSLIGLVFAQIRARKFNPWLYWATIVASTTCGTTLADFADRSLGIGYPGGSMLLLACVLPSLFTWYKAVGTVDVNTVIDAAAKRLSTGSRSRFRRRSARRSATGLPMRDLAIQAARWFSAQGCWSWQLSISRPRSAGSSVLGSVHPHPAARRNRWRLPRQAAEQGRARIEPAARVSGARRRNPPPHSHAPAATRTASRTIESAGVRLG